MTSPNKYEEPAKIDEIMGPFDNHVLIKMPRSSSGDRLWR